jgi:Flp pilus assembly protein TadG
MSLIGSLRRKMQVPPLRRVRRFAADERGITAIEVGLLALPFFAIIGAILETSLVFLGSQVLDNAVQDASRLIRTGQAQSGGFTVDNFRTAVCDKLFDLFNCNNLRISVTTVTDFASATVSGSPLDPKDPTKWVLPQTFSAGAGSAVEMVQVYYKWPVILNFGGLNLATSSDGTHLMGAVRVFANEPFT